LLQVIAIDMRLFLNQNLQLYRLGLIEPVHELYWKCKLPSRLKNSTQKWWHFELRNIRKYVHTAVIMEHSLWHFHVIPWKATYGSKVKECEGYLLPKIKPLKVDNAYFGYTTQISKNLIVDPRVTYCTGIKNFDYLNLIKWKL
jgi:hypothetical protein